MFHRNYKEKIKLINKLTIHILLKRTTHKIATLFSLAEKVKFVNFTRIYISFSKLISGFNRSILETSRL